MQFDTPHLPESRTCENCFTTGIASAAMTLKDSLRAAVSVMLSPVASSQESTVSATFHGVVLAMAGRLKG